MEVRYNEQNFKSLLQKVRIFNKSIGNYEMYAITQDFDYAIKLSNGKIVFKLEELQDDERDALTPERFQAIANRFKPNDVANTDSNSSKSVVAVKEKSTTNGIWLLGAVIFIAVAILAYDDFDLFRQGSASTSAVEDYQEKIMSVDEIERSTPTNFLRADASFNESFWGDKIKVNGTIVNSATVVTFKDVVVRITHYSKTNSIITVSEQTIYEAFPPTSQVQFAFKIDNLKDVTQYGVDVIDASSY